MTATSTSLRALPLLDGPLSYEGAVSVQRGEGWVHPWRLPCESLDLFHPRLRDRAGSPSGVRVTFLSDTTSLHVDAEPVANTQWNWNLLVDGDLVDRQVIPSTEGKIQFVGIGAGQRRMRRIELYLPPQYLHVRLRQLQVDADAQVRSWSDPRLRWVIYGSSIEHAKEAGGGSETWPALVARQFDLHLTNLGFGGQEHLEIPMARVIRDRVADVITLCVGGNVWSGTLTARTYRAAVIGLVQTIRDRHPSVPIAVVSFIHTMHDDNPVNALGIHLNDIRNWTADAVEALRRHGDQRLVFVPGPELFGPADMPLMSPDRVHPGPDGQRLMAQRFGASVMPRLLALR